MLESIIVVAALRGWPVQQLHRSLSERGNIYPRETLIDIVVTSLCVPLDTAPPYIHPTSLSSPIFINGFFCNGWDVGWIYGGVDCVQG